MPSPSPVIARPALLRAAGAFYLTIIAAGLWSELGVRQQLVVPGDPKATWDAVAAALPLYRASLVADSVMVLADIGLAVLLYALFRAVQRETALAALALRLMQAALIGASLLAQIAAIQLVERGVPAPEMLDALIGLHAAGYDFGLIFFGVNTLLTAWLVCRSGLFPMWISPLLLGTGLVYIAGSATRFLAPDLNAAMQPAYLLPMLAESLFCLLLLAGGRRPRAALA